MTNHDFADRPTLPNPAITTPPRIEIGILTKGKPTLGMVLTSLVMQNTTNIRIEIVDTSPDAPVVNRDDIVFALRLAFDRGIECHYDYVRTENRPFSTGKLRLLEKLSGYNICLMDDDIVVPADALSRLAAYAQSTPDYGFVAPFCLNSGIPANALPTDAPRFTPGALFRQDSRVRAILLDYYETTTDALDNIATPRRVWEIGFMTALFQGLGRPCAEQTDNVIYHLDYRARTNWALLEADLLRTSADVARDLLAKHP